MTPCARVAALLVAAVFARAATVHADADHPWDGVWYLDAASSRFALHSLTLSRLPDGRWRYDDGGSICTFEPDGTPYPLLYAPDITMAVTLSGSHALDMVTSSYGRDQERDHWVLSADGMTINDRSTRVYPDGHEKASASKMARVGAGTGFEGTWKDVPDSAATKTSGARGRSGKATKPAGSPAQPAETPPRPYWVISTSVDSVMTWFIPATGELIRGRADGKSRPLTGPQQPARRTFVWKQVSPREIDFFASDSGHLIALAVETLSPDGQSFTDVLWNPGHEGEKDVRVFRRTPR